MNSKITNTEPIKVNVPDGLKRSLLGDAENFEVLKQNDAKVNFNRFISALITGYYEKYQQETNSRYNRIKSLLSSFILNPQKLDQATAQIMNEQSKSDYSNTKTVNNTSFKFHTTKETDSIILQIEEYRRITGDSISAYFRKMLYSYINQPVYEREKIIFQNNVSVINNACTLGKKVIFTTRDRPSLLHRVMPYGIRHGQEELYNYLLCQEFHKSNGEPLAMSYRLCRIVNPRITSENGQIDSKVMDHLFKMEKYAPQYLINEDVESCVEFTANGRKSFMRLYQGRPVVDGKEAEDSDGNIRCYFSCSQEQPYLYFRRFNPGEISVLYPEKLKKRLYEFHYQHLCALKT